MNIPLVVTLGPANSLRSARQGSGQFIVSMEDVRPFVQLIWIRASETLAEIPEGTGREGAPA